MSINNLKLIPFFCFMQCNAATPIILDFGSVSSPSFGSTESEIRYTNVASGINATLTVNQNFLAQTSSNHGSVIGTQAGAEGDVRINMTATADNLNPSAPNNSGIFTLSLWNANAGDGFSVGFTSVSSYEWDLNFYDIDSGSPNPNGFFTYDSLRILTPGTYTLSDSSTIGVVTNADNSVSFSGENTGVVPGQAGLGLPFSTRQINATVQYNIVDRNSIVFEYAAIRNGGNNLGNGRNLLIDGGEISNVFAGVATTSVTIIPEPSSFALILISALSTVCVRRRK